MQPGPNMMTGEVHASRDAAHAAPPARTARGGRQDASTPGWMDVPAGPPQGRTGATPTRGFGGQTILFFALITVVVGAAGFLGIAVWGPDKEIKNRTQLATNPPPPTAMPSLAEPAEPAEPPPAPSAVAASDTPPPVDSAPAKKTKKGAVHAKAKKH
jgi:hypothetical protein